MITNRLFNSADGCIRSMILLLMLISLDNLIPDNAGKLSQDTNSIKVEQYVHYLAFGVGVNYMLGRIFFFWGGGGLSLQSVSLTTDYRKNCCIY